MIFVGPLDLSVNLGIAQQYENPDFLAALDTVARACRDHGKAAGMLVPSLTYLEDVIGRGFTFLVVGSDGGILAGGLKTIRSTCAKFKK